MLQLNYLTISRLSKVLICTHSESGESGEYVESGETVESIETFEIRE